MKALNYVQEKQFETEAYKVFTSESLNILRQRLEKIGAIVYDDSLEERLYIPETLQLILKIPVIHKKRAARIVWNPKPGIKFSHSQEGYKLKRSYGFRWVIINSDLSESAMILTILAELLDKFNIK